MAGVLMVLPPLFVAVGLGFAAFGAYQIRLSRHLRANGVRVPGVVVRLRWVSGEHGGGTFYPVLRFRGPDGTERTVESDVGSNPAPAREGQPVTVVYDPARPGRARLEGAVGSGTVLGAAMIGLGAVVAVVAAVVTSQTLG